MKLICKKCETIIPSSNISLKEGICTCRNCNEFFRVADFLDSEEAIRRTPKPINTKVESFEKTKIIVPARGIKGTAIFLLFFFNCLEFDYLAIFPLIQIGGLN